MLPWLGKTVFQLFWGQIRGLLVVALGEALERFLLLASQGLRQRLDNRRQEAVLRAENAQARAQAAANAAEAEQLRREAALWRQVAEELKADNRALQESLNQAWAAAREESRQGAEALRAETLFHQDREGNPVLDRRRPVLRLEDKR